MIKLTRFISTEQGTIGRLDCDGVQFFTVERPWLNNAPNISCIPDGEYEMVRVDSPKFGENMWEIANVSGRTHILIHIANNPANVEGCIGLGKTIYPNGEGVGSSRIAVEAFYEMTKGVEQEYIIITTTALK